MHWLTGWLNDLIHRSPKIWTMFVDNAVHNRKFLLLYRAKDMNNVWYNMKVFSVCTQSQTVRRTDSYCGECRLQFELYYSQHVCYVRLSESYNGMVWNRPIYYTYTVHKIFFVTCVGKTIWIKCSVNFTCLHCVVCNWRHIWRICWSSVFTLIFTVVPHAITAMFMPNGGMGLINSRIDWSVKEQYRSGSEAASATTALIFTFGNRSYYGPCLQAIFP